MRVSEELFFVLKEAEGLAVRSGGAFDVTCGPVVRLWRRARRQHELPAPGRLAAAVELVGYQHVRLDAKARTVQLLKAGMQLDLGGIAKGYAGDEALRELERNGIRQALVAGGGDIVVGESPPDSPGWTIGIAALEAGERGAENFLVLDHAAASTSGDAEQFVEIGGKRYSHILDPRTGKPVEGRSSVTVVARRGITADSLATAVSVLGPERGLALVESVEGAAVLMERQSERGRERIESERFKEIPRGAAKAPASRSVQE